MPLGLGLAPCEPVVLAQPELAVHTGNAWEVGRLVLAPAWRSNPDILKRCFLLTLLRFIQDHPSANFFATANPLLARLYRRFGFSVAVKDAIVTATDRYSLIHGTVATVRRAVAQDAAAGAAASALPAAMAPIPHSLAAIGSLELAS